MVAKRLRTWTHDGILDALLVGFTQSVSAWIGAVLLTLQGTSASQPLRIRTLRPRAVTLSGVQATIVSARVLLVAALTAEMALVGLGLNGDLHGNIFLLELLALVPFLISLPVLVWARISCKTALMLIIGVGIALQCLALSAPPTSSDDFNRYVWDAKVQLAGIDPYRFAPDSAGLAKLRERPLFYPGTDCAWPLGGGVCSRVNRPEVHTIYPPVAEGAFIAARLASVEANDGARPLQVLAALSAIGVSLLLARQALRNRMPAWTVALWAWCPVTVFELGNNAHIDGVAVLLCVAALVSAQAGRASWAGGLLGGAIATKLYPAVLLPALLGRKGAVTGNGWRVAATAIGVVVVSYVPHVLAVGLDVLGYLPGYLKEENYTNGGRFLLLNVLLPRSILTVAAALLLLAGAALAARWSDPRRPERQAVWLVGLTLLIGTPSYSWYALLLLALVSMSGRIEWLVLCISPTIGMLGADHVSHPTLLRTCCYGLGLLAALVGTGLRQRRKVSNALHGVVATGASPPVEAGSVTDHPQ